MVIHSANNSGTTTMQRFSYCSKFTRFVIMMILAVLQPRWRRIIEAANKISVHALLQASSRVLLYCLSSDCPGSGCDSEVQLPVWCSTEVPRT